ncbi:MAG: leucyl/phenylalanyl-tRNA--protein transferase [Maritimibacter harenae]|jgi:leucyl/phenylalanyl-tRNA--protein transferase|uniref:Leucyl/phenylalanyl-tRNA--protein transferase n=1 Tax=Maritimibacter harenae TaxID=2606218 RepID=A0A845M807_9RHOB|nr:leucyl/phenylalanyl-tRNA--protein transferase [Maritimibacter harenae]MZR12744.1 leucyl/phenylalanyl-tRNA--protein transferase [Maritimibacter harenae]
MPDAPDRLTPEILLHAYASGIFPMAEEAGETGVFWIDPKFRGILPLDGFHLSRSLARTIRNTRMRVTLDTDFTGVVDGCADRDTTWINNQIFDGYMKLYQLGYAHSIEVWDGDALVGGVYGVTLGRAFFGESMFSRRRDASKIALATLVAHLGLCGYELFDTQFITGHLSSLGGVEVPRAEYHRMLEAALAGRAADIRSRPLPDPHSVVQRITQTSKRE